MLDESSLAMNQQSFINVTEPREFTEMAICIDSTKQVNAVNLNPTMQKPEIDLRSVDFVAGGCHTLPQGAS